MKRVSNRAHSWLQLRRTLALRLALFLCFLGIFSPDLAASVLFYHGWKSVVRRRGVSLSWQSKAVAGTIVVVGGRDWVLKKKRKSAEAAQVGRSGTSWAASFWPVVDRSIGRCT